MMDGCGDEMCLVVGFPDVKCDDQEVGWSVVMSGDVELCGSQVFKSKKGAVKQVSQIQVGEFVRKRIIVVVRFAKATAVCALHYASSGIHSSKLQYLPISSQNEAVK